jgi:WD40 repeat protein
MVTGRAFRETIEKLTNNDRLRTANPIQAERYLASKLSGKARSRVAQAFRLSAAALGDEPEEWPTQLMARLQTDQAPALQRILRSVIESRDGCWLKPIRSPLIAAGGAILEIIDVSAPFEDSAALIWSHDGKTVTAFCRTSFRTWDMKAGREVRRLDIPIQWGRAAISDPPRRAVIMAEQRQLLLVDLKTEATNVILDEPAIERVAISADGWWAVATSVPPDWDYGEHEWVGPRIFRLFDLRRRLLVRTWQSHRALVTDLALSADGKFLATVSRDQTARMFDLRTGKTVGCWRSARQLDAVAITPNGRRLAYISPGGVLTVRRQDGKILGRFADCDAEPGCLRLSSIGSNVVMASGEYTSVVDFKKSKRLGPFPGTQPYLSSLAIDRRGRRAITGELGRQLVQWDITKAGKVNIEGAWITGIWAGGEKALVHGHGVSQWDLSTGESNAVLRRGNYTVACAPSAGIWTVARWGHAGGGRIRIGKWGRKQTAPFFQLKDLAPSFQVPSVQISRNGERLVAIIHPQGCQVVNLADQRIVWRREELGLGVRPFLAPSGRYLLLCSLLGWLEIIDLETKETVERSVSPTHVGPILFTPDGESVLLQQGEDTVVLNWRENSLRTLFSGTPSSISEDGHWLVTESKGRKLNLWKLPEERRIATFTLDVPVLHTALSPDGRYLIAGDQLGGVHILQRQG